MPKILIFGNSGSGKSTLARELSEVHGLAHLDLDTLAWLSGAVPERAPLEESREKIEDFTKAHEKWVIEGCYTDLLEMVGNADEVIFLNLDVSRCVENARNRPWEPHKYESKEAQDKNLGMLVEWIEQYTKREDVFSYLAHRDFYENFDGKKIMYVDNDRNTCP